MPGLRNVRTGSIAAPTTDKSSYIIQAVVMTAKVSAVGAPVARAAVSFTLTATPTHWDGSAIFKYRLRKRDPAGTWDENAAGSLNATTGTAVAGRLFQ